MDLDIAVFGEITLRQCLYGLGAVVGITMVSKIVKPLLFPPKPNLQHSVAFTCLGCGWKGHIGKYAHNCPKCSQPVN